MLVLTRKQNEKVQIGDNITVTVLRMKGKSVRLGIHAPDSVSVLRGELVFELADEEATEVAKPQADATQPHTEAEQPHATVAKTSTHSRARSAAKRPITAPAVTARHRQQPTASWPTSPKAKRSHSSAASCHSIAGSAKAELTGG